MRRPMPRAVSPPRSTASREKRRSTPPGRARPARKDEDPMPVKSKEHRYSATIRWTGNRGTGTSGYRDYGRDHEIAIEGKPPISGSSDPAFRGDRGLHNPEDLLVCALSACHMLSYLHLCAVSGVVVAAYEDRAEGT